MTDEQIWAALGLLALGLLATLAFGIGVLALLWQVWGRVFRDFPEGRQGPVGPPGMTGATGPMGNPGPRGPAGRVFWMRSPFRRRER